MQTDQRVRDYVDANGVRTYYEIIGEGEPVLLLHGGMCTLETWEPQIAALSAKYKLIMPERRGHGRTADVPGPVTYDVMVDDTIAFMTTLRIESAHVVGWSDGAMVGLLLARKRPDLVKKLVHISQPINFDGARPKFRAMLEHLSPAHLPPWMEQAYAAVSPDGPGHYAEVAAKFTALWRTEPNLPLDILRTVAAPTLILVGDDDIQSIADAGAMQAAFPSAQLAVVPGTSHALVREKPEVVNRLILDFLHPDQVKKMFPGG